MLGTSQTARSHRAGALNLDSTWGREFKRPQRRQLIGLLSKGKFAFHPHFVSKSWRLCYTNLCFHTHKKKNWYNRNVDDFEFKHLMDWLRANKFSLNESKPNFFFVPIKIR